MKECEEKGSRVFLLRILFLCIPYFLLNISSGFAKPLDIYQSHQHFPADLLFPENYTPDLTELKKEQIDSTIQRFISATINNKDSDKNSLLYLAVGYLYLQKKDSHNSLRYLDHHIVGNFILEDYRMEFQAAALNLSAQVKLEKKRFADAISDLNESMNKRLKIFRVYPESPLNSQIPRGLAETEKLLGDAYFQIRNFKAAWRYYRRAMMREFPDQKNHQLNVYLSLAKTYEATGELRNAIEIYLYLSENFQDLDGDLKITIAIFVSKYEVTLREMGIDLTSFKDLDAVPKAETPVKEMTQATQNELSVHYENELLNQFYQAADQNDFTSVMEQARKYLVQYPGLYESRQVLKKANNLIVDYLDNNEWEESIDLVTDIYPAEILDNLAMRLWKNGHNDGPARLYRKILNKYSLQTLLCHKAVFFLGRIMEDEGKFADAISFYENLLKKYDFGPYTPAALFKIPWLERLQGRYDLAEIHFQRSLEFYDTDRYRQWAASFNNRSSYLSASLFWKGQLIRDQKKEERGLFELEQLVKKHPLDFYAVISRGKLNLKLKDYFMSEKPQEIAYRKPGLGEVEQKYLQRAEKLMAVGFLNEGIEELKKISQTGQKNDFLFYLSKLFHRGKGFQKSIQLTWRISAENRSEGITGDLAIQLFPQAYIEKVNGVAKNYGIDPLWILSLMRQESAFNAKIVSSADAIGLMQLLPSTAGEIAADMGQEGPTIEELKNPEINIRLGISYLNHLLSLFNGNVVFALAGYNAGPAKVNDWVALRSHLSPLEFIESIPYQETRDYVKKVIRNYYIYTVLYRDKKIHDLNEILTIPIE